MTYVELIQERRSNAWNERDIGAMNTIILEVLRQYEALEASITCKCGHTILDHTWERKLWSIPKCHARDCDCGWWEQ